MNMSLNKFAIIYVSQNFCSKVFVEDFVYKNKNNKENLCEIDVFYMSEFNILKFKETILHAYDFMIYLNDITTYNFKTLEQDINSAIFLIYSQKVSTMCQPNQVLLNNYAHDCIDERILTKNKDYLKNEISVFKIKPNHDCANILYEPYKYKQFNRFLIPSIIKTSLLLNYSSSNLSHVCLSSNNIHSEFIFLQTCIELTRTVIETSETMRVLQYNPLCNLKLNKNVNSDLTMVTGFITLNEQKIQKYAYQTYTYKDASIKTLQMNVNMVIYITSDLYEFVLEKRTEFGLIHKTKIIQIQSEDYLYEFGKFDRITESIKKNHPNYSSAKKMLSVLARYNYLKDCIENNYFNNTYFAWIDFGAGHIVDIPQNIVFDNCFGNQVRIGWVARYNRNKFKYNHKVLAGGFFIGNKSAMLELIEKHNQYFNILLDYKFVINDDKLLFFIFESNPFLFDTYFTSYANILQRVCL